jgi:hypothetical protein
MRLFRLLFVWLFTLQAWVAAAETLRVTVPGGEAVTVPGTELVLTLTRVTDRRCPSIEDLRRGMTIRCGSTGLIAMTFSAVLSGQTPKPIYICNDCFSVGRQSSVGPYRITLLKLKPTTEELAKLDRPAAMADYRVVVEVIPK